MKKYIPLVAAVMIAVLFFACGKDKEPVEISKTVSIAAITPSQGMGSIHVTIKGANFSGTAAGNLVLFHTDTAVITLASADSLVVTVPLHGTTGPVSVTVAGETAIGPVFTYLADTTGVDTTRPAEDSVDIYAAGFDSRPVYWLNGTENYLPLPSSSTFAGESGAYAIALLDTDVYIAGTYKSEGLYWKNGMMTLLSTNPTVDQSEARAIAVSGSDIYIGGSDIGQPVYWKNGIKTILSANRGIVNGIVIDNGDVYAAGKLQDTAVVWKNGVYTKLSTLLTSDVDATGVVVSGNDVYVCGAEDGAAVLWKNAVKTILAPVPANKVASRANAVAIAGNNILVAGNDGSDAAYWLNGAEVKLTQENSLITATAIALYNNDVYIAGNDLQSRVSLYWKNGVRYVFPSGIGSGVYAIAVVKHR